VHVEVEVVRLLPLFDESTQPKLSALYLEFLEEISDALRQVKLTNPQSVRKTSMLMLGTTPVYGIV